MTQPSLSRAVSETSFWVSALLLIAFGGFLPAQAFADVPALLPIQGYLTDKQGAAVDGGKNVHFRLYSVATGGTPIHEETIAVVAVNGYFTAYLGDDSASPLDLAAVRDSPKLFLGIEIGSDGEAVPRLQLASTAFAAQAQYCADATNLGGKAPSAFAPSMHTHDWSEITGKPDSFPPAPHMHGSADIMCYADLVSEGYLDNNNPDDLLTQSQGDDRFAANVHTHDAGDITAGTLSEALYSAYSDLNGEGFLDANNGNDLLTLAQGDMRYVSPMEANSIGSNMIIDGQVTAADLAIKSVTMDKTSAPLGASYINIAIAASSSAYVYASPSLLMDSPGTCVFTALARTTSSGITASFFTYPSVEVGGSTTVLCSNTTTGGNSCAGTYGYGTPAVGSVTSLSTPSMSGAFDVMGGTSYRFGCFISAGSAGTYTCAVSWVCN
jgi:hypothetical protein